MKDWSLIESWLMRVRPPIIVSRESPGLKRWMQIWPTHKKLIVRVKQLSFDHKGGK